VLGRPGLGAPLDFESAWANLTLTPHGGLALARNVSDFAAQHIESEIKPLIMSNSAVDETAIFISMVDIFMKHASRQYSPSLALSLSAYFLPSGTSFLA
jgi:hypothetical protein